MSINSIQGFRLQSSELDLVQLHADLPKQLARVSTSPDNFTEYKAWLVYVLPCINQPGKESLRIEMYLPASIHLLRVILCCLSATALYINRIQFPFSNFYSIYISRHFLAQGYLDTF